MKYIAFLLIGGFLALAGLGIFWHKREVSSEPEMFTGEPFRASIITDIDHCPSRKEASPEHLQRFLDTAQSFQPDFIASLGDNASHRLSDCSATADQDARFIAERLRSAGPPTYLILGDHDIGSSVSSYEAWLTTTGRKETYYSFEVKDVHVIVLDTVLGGEPLSPPCEEKETCRLIEERRADYARMPFSEYLKKYSDSRKGAEEEKKRLKNALEEAEDEIALTRSSGKRDQGRLSAKQLEWLEADLKQNKKEKILVLSDHPLFRFVSVRKTYDIAGGEAARKLLVREEREGKQVVAISGEAHLWYEEEQEGIQYYIVDEFRNANGSWAQIVWPNEGFRLERLTH